MSKEIKELHDAILRITQSVVVHTPRYSKFGGYDGENDIYTMDIARVLYHEENYRKQSVGEWKVVDSDVGYVELECSLCKHKVLSYTNTASKFCPNCGAKMKGGEE